VTGGGILRGMRQRAGASIGILLVALVAAAAATTGPVYDTAARTSILRDALATAAVLDRAAQVTVSGPISGLAGNLTARAGGRLADYLGGAAELNRMFQAPMQDAMVQVVPAGPAPAGTGPDSQPLALTWHTGQCARLRLAAGTCPAAPGQVMVSTSYAADQHVKPGDTITTKTQGLTRLNVTGVYVPPPIGQLSSDYWLAGPCADFAHEFPCNVKPGAVDAPPPGPDALFTDPSTFDRLPDAVQGQATAWWVLSPGSVQGRDLPTLTAAANGFLTDPAFTLMNAQASSTIPQLAGRVASDWSALDVPVILIVGQLLLLAWLLLFLVATDAAEARAAEVALARLRGYGRARTVAFGLSEPALLLLIAFPAGALAGWAFTAGLGRLLLRPGTPVTLPWPGAAAAAAATLGGFIAIGAASRRALTRPVTEQWKRTARDATRRGWALDAVLLTGAAAGLAELFTGGYSTGARSGSLGLLVPGLLGLAAAVVASRLLPLACLLAFAPTRRGGGTALFLAARHIARRPGGTRTTIVLAAAFALATFGLASYAVGQRNITRVATAQTGADGALTVVTPPGQDLGAIVDRIDPGGTRATVVDTYVGAPNSSILLAVQPERFATVASWLPGFAAKPPRELAAALSPPTAPPVQLPATATGLRVRATAVTGVPPGTVLTFWVSQTSAGGQTPLATGALRDGWLTVAVWGCPCQLTMLSADAPVAAQAGRGSLTLSDPQVRAGGTWTPLAGALANPGQAWRPASESGDPACSGDGGTVASTGAASVHWSFTVSGGCGPALKRNDIPAPMPALVATGVTTTMTSVPTLGLDGQGLTVAPVALAAAVPGAPSEGIVVDRTLARRAAYFANGGFASEQVWTAPGALPEVKARLAAAKVTITGQATIGQAEQVLRRQGPALASVLFLATAGMAAVLAAGAAVLGLYQAGRRRRHEYAALVAGRVTRRSLRASVLIEQAVVLGYGALTGVAAGLAAALLTLRNIPEFSPRPLSPPLLFQPPPGQVAEPLVVIGLVIGVTASTAALAVVRAARPELLRQAQP
jgi:putative ABC transport system permease protein